MGGHFLKNLRLGVGLALVAFCIAPISFAEVRSSPAELPRKLVLAMDGISYFDMKRLQAEGHFTTFHPVSRAISTFPSLSDIAWSDIFRTARPNGYQRFHYSVRANRIVGGALTDLGNPIEYEKRMHLAFENLGHHTYSYMFAKNAARLELDQIIERFLQTQDTSTFYAYMLSTDTLQHTDGDILGFLRLLDRRLVELQRNYHKRTGLDLQITLLSDHGNTQHKKGKRVPIKEFLEERGFHVAQKLQNERDVVFTAAGILSSLTIFSAESQILPIVENLLELKGIDLITHVLPDSDTIWIRSPGGEKAVIRKLPSEKRYAYLPVRGDPLGYGPVLERLFESGRMSSDGFAHSDDWLEASSAHHYPAAVERIYRGHHVVTLNPARILVSLKDGYENANNLVKFMTHLKKRGGTHGALSEKSSNGILMSNSLPTRDLTTDRISSFFQFSDLPDHRKNEAGAKFTDSRVTGHDLDHDSTIESEENLGPEHETFLNIWDPAAKPLADAGVLTRYRFTVKHNGLGPLNGKISRREFLADSLPRLADGTEFRLPLSLVAKSHLQPGEYFIKVHARRLDAKTRKLLANSRLALVRFFTDLDGQVVAY